MLKIKSIKPMNTMILTTADRYEDDSTHSGIILKTSGSIKEYQRVVAVGSMVRDIKVGDIVMINPTRYMKKQFSDNSLREEFVENPTISVNIPIVEINEAPHFMLNSGTDIDYIIDDYEEIPESKKSPIIKPKPKTIVTPKIII